MVIGPCGATTMGSGMRVSSKVGLCAAVLTLALAGGAASSAAAAPKQACGLAPASTIASDLGMLHVSEHGSTTADTGSGGLETECHLRAWSGSKARARTQKGSLAELTIETAEEDTGSPFAPKWTASGARQTREAQEDRFKEVIAEAEGYVSTRHVGSELWDRAQVDNPALNLSGFDEIAGHGKRDIYVTWRASQPIGRSIALNLVIDERKHAFVQLNRIAESVVPAFALAPGEFGSSSAPTPEQRPRPVQRYTLCPSAVRLKEAGGVTFEHFEVLHVSCSRAVAVMRASN